MWELKLIFIRSLLFPHRMLLPQLFSQRLLSLLSKRKKTSMTVYFSLNSLKSLIAQFLTFFRDSIHRLHAGFNVVGDVTVEQPFTRVLRTHLYCLKRRKSQGVIYCQVEILFMFHSTDKLSCCSCMLMMQNLLNSPDFNRFFFFYVFAVKEDSILFS